MNVTNLDELRSRENGPQLLGIYCNAKLARDKAFKPYSGFAVGSCVVLRDGSEHVGSNMENAAFGPTICAERTAITSANARLGPLKSGDIAIVFVVTDTGDKPSPPCGTCRGVIAQFDTEDTVVYASNLDGSVIREFRMGELLPYAFERESSAYLIEKK